MNNNPELGNNGPADSEADQWGSILPKENFYESRQNSQEAEKTEPSDEEIKQRIIAEKRNEKLKEKAEAREKANRVAAKLLAVAITATAFVGGLIATGPKDDFLKSEQAKQKVIEMENAKEIVFHGNIRSNPEIPNSEDTNVYANIEDEVRFKVPEDAKILYLKDDSDPNGGGWIAIPAAELAKKHYISEKEANKDGDGYTWVNTGNARTVTSSTPSEEIN